LPKIVPTGSERANENALAGPLYCDASALAKLFLPEPGSDELNAAIAGRDDLLVSDLAVTEVASALGRRVRERTVSRPVAQRVHRGILTSTGEGAFRRVELLESTHREAERRLLTGAQPPLRGADALHLAMALGAGAATVLTYDRVMARAAIDYGLAVWPALSS
jgi:predicted nucleic acid-binding protein